MPEVSDNLTQSFSSCGEARAYIASSPTEMQIWSVEKPECVYR